MTELIRHIEGELGKITDPIYRDALGVVLERMKVAEADTYRCPDCLYYKIEACSRMGLRDCSPQPCVYWEEGTMGMDTISY